MAAIQTFEKLNPCCVYAADAPTSHKELFELKPVADGVYAAIAAPRYKVNCNAAVILTDNGVVVVASHSKRAAAYALYKEIQAITQQPFAKSSTRTSTRVDTLAPCRQLGFARCSLIDSARAQNRRPVVDHDSRKQVTSRRALAIVGRTRPPRSAPRLK